MVKDEFIKDTPFGKLMKNCDDSLACLKCRWRLDDNCEEITSQLCLNNDEYYFAKTDRASIMESLEDIQDKVDEMNFKGGNEHDLHLRECIADYIEQNFISK